MKTLDRIIGILALGAASVGVFGYVSNTSLDRKTEPNKPLVQEIRSETLVSTLDNLANKFSKEHQISSKKRSQSSNDSLFQVSKGAYLVDVNAYDNLITRYTENGIINFQNMEWNHWIQIGLKQ